MSEFIRKFTDVFRRYSTFEELLIPQHVIYIFFLCPAPAIIACSDETLTSSVLCLPLSSLPPSIQCNSGKSVSDVICARAYVYVCMYVAYNCVYTCTNCNYTRRHRKLTTLC